MLNLPCTVCDMWINVSSWDSCLQYFLNIYVFGWSAWLLCIFMSFIRNNWWKLLKIRYKILIQFTLQIVIETRYIWNLWRITRQKICPTCLPGLGAFFDFERQISNHISLQIKQKPDTQQNPAINTQQKQVNMYVQMKDVSCIILWTTSRNKTWSPNKSTHPAAACFGLIF